MVGGLYAMFAIGLALIFGVMKLVNIAHGDLIVLAAYIGLVVTQTLGFNPLAALVVVIPIMALVGYALQRGLFNRTHGRRSDAAAAGVVRSIDHHAERLPRAVLGRQPAPASRRDRSGERQAHRRDQHRRAAAAAIGAGDRSSSRRCNCSLPHRDGPSVPRRQRRSAYRAIDGPRQSPRVRAGDGAVAGDRRARRSVAGDPRQFRSRRPGRRGSSSASRRSSSADLSSFWGTLAGGIILGVVQSVASAIDPGLQVLAGHVAFLIVLAIRPYGLFGRPA